MHKYVRFLLCTALYLGCAQFAFVAFVQKPGNPDVSEKDSLTSMVDGSGYRPFVYRTLLPSTVRLIRALLPDRVKVAIAETSRDFSPLRALLASTPAREERDPTTFLVAYALEFGCLLGFMLVLRWAVAEYYAPTAWLADLLPLGAALCLPVFYRYHNHDYDLPQLFLFTWGVLLLERRRWRWFYPVLVLGALSKETTLLLVVVHVLGNASRMPRARLLRHAAAQLIILASIRGLLQFVLFADNPGMPVEYWFDRNWGMISDPSRWSFLFLHFTWVGRHSLVLPTNYNLLFLLLVPLIFWRWSEKPVLLRRALCIVPILSVLGMFCGYIDEMRIYYEAYAIVFLLVAGTVCRCATTDPVENAIEGPAGPVPPGPARIEDS